MIGRVVAFADSFGLPLLMQSLPRDALAGVVAASIRAHQHEALGAMARRYGAPLLIQPRRTDESYEGFLRDLRALHPEFLIVNSYSMKLWPEVLGVAPKGGVNVHGALLPQYRGANPTQWAIICGERESGVTIHQLVAEIDAGAIVAQRRVPIRFEDTWRDVQARIADTTAGLLDEILPEILAERAVAVPQDAALARTFPRRRPEDGRLQLSARVIDLYNVIRALVAPHPGAFYDAPGGRVVIDRYLTIAEVAALKHSVGRIAALNAHGLALKPTPDECGRTVIAFAISEPRGVEDARFFLEIDWPSASARAWAAGLARIQAELAARGIGLVREFARQELGLQAALATVDAPPPHACN